MNFSQLIEFRNLVQKAYAVDEINSGVDQLRRDLDFIIGNVICTDDLRNGVINLATDFDNVALAIHSNQHRYQVLTTEINRLIEIESTRLLNISYNTLDYSIANPIDDTLKNEVSMRIQSYCSWQYPALEFGARDDTWCHNMVAGDPLYIASRTADQLDRTLHKFNPEYRRRLRGYVIDDYCFDQLPQGQFSFVFAWDYFNHVDLKETTLYLKAVYSLLRPGGTFMFSFNDGNTPAGAGFAESGANSYIPSTILRLVSEGVGFEIASLKNPNHWTHWVELRKPGYLTSVRGAQTLGEIRTVNT